MVNAFRTLIVEANMEVRSTYVVAGTENTIDASTNINKLTDFLPFCFSISKNRNQTWEIWRKYNNSKKCSFVYFPISFDFILSTFFRWQVRNIFWYCNIFSKILWMPESSSLEKNYTNNWRFGRSITISWTVFTICRFPL